MNPISNTIYTFYILTEEIWKVPESLVQMWSEGTPPAMVDLIQIIQILLQVDPMEGDTGHSPQNDSSFPPFRPFLNTCLPVEYSLEESMNTKALSAPSLLQHQGYFRMKTQELQILVRKLLRIYAFQWCRLKQIITRILLSSQRVVAGLRPWRGNAALCLRLSVGEPPSCSGIEWGCTRSGLHA